MTTEYDTTKPGGSTVNGTERQNMAPSDDALRQIARRASTAGSYSGGVKPLRAAYEAGRVDVQKWLAAELRENAHEFEEFAPGRAVELLSYFLEYLSLPSEAAS